MRLVLRTLLAVLLCSVAPQVRADGPHWQVPCPDDGDEEEEEKKEPGVKTPRNPQIPDPEHIRPLKRFRRNPGSFVNMDDAARAYFVQHCALARATDKQSVYIQIVHRAAQAMREVETYCPCPDSYPLWQSEENRERMVQYAMRIWERVRELPPETAAACAELAVECYIDSVRFAADARKKDGPLRKHFDVNRKVSDLLMQMSSGKNADATAKYYQTTQQLRMVLPSLLKEFRTFAPWKQAPPKVPPSMLQYIYWETVTGDIPLQGDDTESRMRQALIRMGPVALPWLQKHSRHTNTAVAKAVTTLIERINEEKTKASFGTVLDLIKVIAADARSQDAAAAIKRLGELKGPLNDQLLRLLKHEEERIRDYALLALQTSTGKNYSGDYQSWKRYLDEERRKADEAAANTTPAEPKDEPVVVTPPKKKKSIVPLKAEDAEDLPEDTSTDFVIKKKPGYLEFVDD